MIHYYNIKYYHVIYENIIQHIIIQYNYHFFVHNKLKILKLKIDE